MELKATINNESDLQGKFWSSGIHHVFVNDKPATVYVPENSIIPTFQKTKDKIEENNRIPLGIDHLSDEILKDNQILAKLNLLDVGDVTQIGTDGKGLYVINSQITNNEIKKLNNNGELPAYSIMASFNAKECPSGKVDYILEDIDITRIDLVEQGGCQDCEVGNNPNNLKLYAKNSDNMEDDKKQEINDKIQELKDLGVEITLEEEEQEEVEEQEEEEETETSTEEEEQEEQEEADPSIKDLIQRIDDQDKEIKELKKIGGKKPPENKTANDEVDKLIKAGLATPKMKKGLIATYNADKEAFQTLKASLPKIVDLSIKAKLGVKTDEEKKQEKQEKAQSETKKLAKEVFNVEL